MIFIIIIIIFNIAIRPIWKIFATVLKYFEYDLLNL